MASMQATYPKPLEEGNRRAWVREHLADIALIGPELPPTIRDVVRLGIHLGAPDRAVLYGSRARGEARANSDYDLCFFGVRNRAGFRNARLDGTGGYITLLPVDMVLDIEASPELLAEIAREGVVLYERPGLTFGHPGRELCVAPENVPS